MTSKRLTPAQVHAVGRAAVENALNLMSDSLTLLDAGRARRAYAIGVIAVEEMAKYLVCRQALEPWTGTLTVAELNATLRPAGGKAHVRRYATTLEYLASMTPWVPLPPGIRTFTELALSDMRARERTLYVEVASSGVPMRPEDVSEEEARSWVSAMGRYFAMLAKVWAESLDDALAAVNRP